MKKFPLLLVLLWAGFAFGQNKLTLEVSQAKEKINKELYTQFAEHLGHCIYGGIYVGENSKIPNTKGIRNDVAKALKELKVPVLRWPGGCFADTYHWKDGIGDKSKRPSIVNVHWGGTTEDNSFGTHEFMDLCEMIEAEPYISGNIGSGTVQEMSEWVEYLTSDAESPMTKLRKQNGREKPWKVKYFGVGNEPWGCGGEMMPEYYANLFRQYASYCRNYGDNKLYKIAAGPNGGNYNDAEVLMKNIGKHMNGLSIHYYTLMGNWPPTGYATEFDKKDWYQIMYKTLEIDSMVKKYARMMDKYDPNKKIGLMFDEWGTWFEVEKGTNKGFLYQQNSLRDALVAGLNLNVFNNNCDRVKMTAIAQVVNVLQAMILTKDEKMVLTPTYYVFKMYNVHQDATLVPSKMECTRYKEGKIDIPTLNASSSIDSKGNLNITLCNLDVDNAQKLPIDLKVADYKNVKAEIVTANKMNAYNDFDKAEEVSIKDFKDFKLKGSNLDVNLPSKSVIHLQLSK